MRKILGLLALALALAQPAPVQAQAGFMMGMIIGNAMTSDSNKAGGGSDVIYRAELPPDRKIDWRYVHTNRDCSPEGDQLWKVAGRMMKNPDLWDVLEIRRSPNGGGGYCLWFTYIQKGT